MDMEEIIALVEKAKNGDQSAIAQLYEATSKAVYFTALKIVGNPSDAEDIAQDTYVTAISKLSDLKDNATFPKWIKTIAANTAKNYMTKKKPMLFNTDEDEEATLGSIPEVSDEFIPDQAADKKETCRLVSEMIDSLPEKQRAALVMFYYDEMTISEIAEAMGTNDNTIKSRLNYARKYIKDEVEALAKKGTKLYGVAGIPLIAFVLRNLAADTAVPTGIAAKVTAATAATTTAAATATTATATATATATTAAASTAATGVALGTAAKVAIAAVASVAVIGGGVAVANVVSEPTVFKAEAGTPSEFELMLEDYLFGDGELDTKYFGYVEELYIYGDTVAVNRDMYERCGYNYENFNLFFSGDDYWSFLSHEYYSSTYRGMSDIEEHFMEEKNMPSNLTNIHFVEEMSQIELLEITFNSISDISVLSDLSNLKTVNLSCNNISDISPLINMNELEWINLQSNKISQSDILMLRTALPDCEIIADDYDYEYEDVIAKVEPVVTTTAATTTTTPVTTEITTPAVTLPEAEFGVASEIELMLENYLFGDGELDTEYFEAIEELEICGEFVAVNRTAEERLGIENGHIVWHGEKGIWGIISNDSHDEISSHPFGDLTDLSFVSEMKNLTSLDVGYNNVSDISGVMGLGKLEKLVLYNNAVNDISPVKGLSKLKTLSLGSNEITDISPISGLKNLEKLYLQENDGITDYSSIKNLSNLEYLIVNYGNYLSDISFLSGTNKLKSLTIAVADSADLSPIKNLKALESLRFYLPYFEETETYLDLSYFSELTNLKELCFYGGAVSDISPLSGLVKLKDLELNIANGTSISPLSGLVNLEKLSLNGEISDLSYLSGLVKLKDLDLHIANGASISPLKNMTNLEKLNIYINLDHDISLESGYVSDLSSLSEMTKLTYLRMYIANGTDISPLKKLVNLETLALLMGEVSDLSPLSDLVKLKDLDLNIADGTDISPLKKLVKLETLYLSTGSSGEVSDLSPLSDLIKLRSLAIAVADETDVSPLKNLVNLETLDISGAWNLSPLSKLTKLKWLTVTNYGLSRDEKDKIDYSPLKKLTNLEHFHVYPDLNELILADLQSALPNCEIW